MMRYKVQNYEDKKKVWDEKSRFSHTKSVMTIVFKFDLNQNYEIKIKMYKVEIVRLKWLKSTWDIK